MAGNTVTVVVDRHAVYPVGICVDTDRQRVYWYDAEFRSIFMSKYDGTDLTAYHTPFDYGISILNLEVYRVSSHTKSQTFVSP